nr:hypothetical protein BdHM001_35230 [Bdellovibrio sp. HM001]
MRKVIAVILLLLSATVSAQTITIHIPHLEKSSENQRLGGIGRVADDGSGGLLSVYIRGCGKVSLTSNSKGETPKAGAMIEYYYAGRCAISDWKDIGSK